MSHPRSLRALMVDVGPTHATQLSAGLTEAGWTVGHEHADGADELSAALARRGWDAVLYGGDRRGAVPARKALALVRLADPQLPFLAVSPYARRGELSSVIRGLDGAVAHVSNSAELALALERELGAARLRRRVGGAHRFLLAQQAISDHLAAGLAPDELCARVLATLGETLGWSLGVVWHADPEASVLRCAGAWHAPDAPAEVVAFARATRTQQYAPGQGTPGRVWAFRRPSWVPDVSRDGGGGGRSHIPRAAQALRAGLMTAVAFPVAVGDDCAGVIEFFSPEVHEQSADVSAMFATVGGQLAHYLRRRRAQDAESLRLHAALDRTRGFLDAAGALIVVLDGDGRVDLANTRACAALGLAEAELLGRDWLAVAGVLRGVAWHEIALDDAAGVLLVHGGALAARRLAAHV